MQALLDLKSKSGLSSDAVVRLNQLLISDAFPVNNNVNSVNSVGDFQEPESISGLLAKQFTGTLTPDDTVRLNHLLLIQAFPDALVDQTVSIDASGTTNVINAGGFTAAPFGQPFPIAGSATVHSLGIGIGATVFLLNYKNTANAFIDDGAVVNANGDIDVASHTDTEIYNYTKQGGQAHSVGIDGDIVITTLNNQNLAYIQNTAQVQAGGDVSVHADQNEFVVAITGATTNEAPIGVGISVSVNTFTNDTRAFIGNVNSTASPLPLGFVKSGASVSVTATTAETVFGTAFSGVIANGAGEHDAHGSTDTDASAPTSLTQGDPVANAHKSAGVAISGASVVFDMHQDSTKAYIAGALLVEAPEKLTVKATSNLLLMNVSGVLAVQSDPNSTSNVAIAGGFSYNAPRQGFLGQPA